MIGAQEPKHRSMAAGLRVAAAAVAVLTGAAVVLPAGVARWCSTAAVAALIGVPVLRVAWLCARWLRRGDRRFGLIAAGVLAVVACAALLA